MYVWLSSEACKAQDLRLLSLVAGSLKRIPYRVTLLLTPVRNLYPTKLEAPNETNPEFQKDALLLSKTLNAISC